MAIKILKNANLLHERTHQGDSIKKRIDMVSKAILNIENEKRKFINIWLEAKNQFQFPTELINTYGLGDDGISYPVHDKQMSGLRVGAVDGSVLRESMLGIDLIASKARGVVFNFKKDTPPDVSYYPVETNSNFNLFGVFQGSSFREIEFYSNVERLLAELELVHQVIAREN
ncbi:hypothetical protein GF325_04275, partial [Candidatus Bathyarchaeota archaeon]|nr:hypothetical protein [Candidatus Bathyarchaeota archaeon]